VPQTNTLPRVHPVLKLLGKRPDGIRLIESWVDPRARLDKEEKKTNRASIRPTRNLFAVAEQIEFFELQPCSVLGTNYGIPYYTISFTLRLHPIF
jgi:hypothetical protein